MAIAYDSSGTLARANTSSLSGSFTNTAGDALWVDVMLDGTISNLVTGVTYNGVAMTQIDTQARSNVIDVRIYTYFMIAPATGSNTLTVSLSSSAQVRATAVSYRGVKQSTTIDNQIITNAINVNSPKSRNLTPVADNCWVRAVFYVSGNTNLAAGTATTARQTNTSGTNSIISVDGNALIHPAADTSLEITFTSVNIDCIILMQSFAPLTSTTTTLNLSETPSITERFSRAVTAPRSFSEKPVLSESMTRAWSATRGLAERITITESTLTGRFITAVLSELVAIGDSISRLVSYTRSFNESPTITERFSRSIAVMRNFSESIGLTDTLTRAVNYGRILIESISILEYLRTPLNWLKRTKPTSTWTARTTPSPTSPWTSRTPPSSTWTPRTKP